MKFRQRRRRRAFNHRGVGSEITAKEDEGALGSGVKNLSGRGNGAYSCRIALCNDLAEVWVSSLAAASWRWVNDYAEECVECGIEGVAGI